MDEVTGAREDEALARAVHAVYAVEPAGFVATRKEWVQRLRSEGLREVAKQVSVLRKPSVSAAAVNALVRADDPVVARLEDVGARLRHAQSTLDAAALSALRDARDEVLAAWVAAARAHSGGSLTAAVEAEVRDTAVAALADPAATAVVTSGTLTRALSYSGFGEVDVADAVARTSTGVMLSRIEGGRGGDEAGEDEVVEEDEEDEEDEVDKESEVDEEVEDLEVEEVEDAEDLEEGEDDVDEDDLEEDGDTDLGALEMVLDEAEKVVAAARAARRRAITEHAAAEENVTSAAEHLAEAQRLLEQARTALEEAEAEHGRTTAALEEAEEELRRSRRQRDAARVALEEAEDS